RQSPRSARRALARGAHLSDRPLRHCRRHPRRVRGRAGTRRRAAPPGREYERNMMLLTERRKQYRRVLEGGVCVHPASVFDAMSARMAESLGFEVGMFAGSIASGTVLGAPDLVVLTLTEFAEQIRRIARGSDLPLMVGGAPPALSDRAFLASQGVRIALQGHHPFYAAAKAVYDTLKYLREGGAPAGLKDRVASEELLKVALRQDEYKRRQATYLR